MDFSRFFSILIRFLSSATLFLIGFYLKLIDSCLTNSKMRYMNVDKKTTYIQR